jgi:hypothetical protein
MRAAVETTAFVLSKLIPALAVSFVRRVKGL